MRQRRKQGKKSIMILKHPQPRPLLPPPRDVTVRKARGETAFGSKRKVSLDGVIMRFPQDIQCGAVQNLTRTVEINLGRKIK